MATSVVVLVKTTEVAAVAPKETVEAGVKLAPVMVTAVAPISGPEVGVMAVTVGMDRR